jgi:hypothetical protein
MASEPTLESPTTYLSAVASALAERIVDIVVVEGPDNIKTTISDSLRHGKLRNRFLLTFDRAISLASTMPLDTTALIADLGLTTTKDGSWLASLRSDLIGLIRDFNAQSLTVTDPTHFRASFSTLL